MMVRNKKPLLIEAFEAGVLMAKLRPLPELPPMLHDEEAKAILKILKPKPEQREECLEDIRMAFTAIERETPRYKEANKALARLLAALKRAHAAKTKLPWQQVHYFETVCDLAAGITLCENEQKQTTKRIPRPPRHRQMQAVMAAYALTQRWLPRNARSLSRQSPWYKLSAILFGKKVNLLAHMSRYKKG
jgi:hypothetical protein